jgi:general secretion pathway protein G
MKDVCDPCFDKAFLHAFGIEQLNKESEEQVPTLSTAIYERAFLLAQETVLFDHLCTLRSVIEEFTLNKDRPPCLLDELVVLGYLGRILTDPFTGSSETWEAEIGNVNFCKIIETNRDDVHLVAKHSARGIIRVHSGSGQISLQGTPYNSWQRGAASKQPRPGTSTKPHVSPFGSPPIVKER